MKQRYSPRIYKDDLSRLLAKAEQDGSCWIWKAANVPSGYGCFRFRGRQDYAHRVSYTLHHGEIPDGYFVMHQCDRPACINPCHLRAVQPALNTHDMLAKGRHRANPNRGPDNHRAKLTAEQVRRIRAIPFTVKPHKVAEMFGVGRTTINNIRQGKTYASV